MFYDKNKSKVLTEEELRKAMYPSTLPVDITVEALEGTPYVPVKKGSRPTPSVIKKVVPDKVVEDGGNFVLNYKLVSRYKGENKAAKESEALEREAARFASDQARETLKSTKIESPTVAKLAARIALIEQYLKL